VLRIDVTFLGAICNALCIWSGQIGQAYQYDAEPLGIFCCGTVGWARTTDLLFHSKRSPELHGTSWCLLRRKNIQINHILSAYLSLTPLHFVSGYLTSLGTFLEPFDGA
jgi:hypothetical protein